MSAAPLPVDDPTRSPRIDAWRGVAALAVLLYHGWWFSGGGAWPAAVWERALVYLLDAGWAGVGVFFTLSGFVLTRSWLGRDASAPLRRRLADYAARRALRILPAYWLQLVLLAALLAWGFRHPTLQVPAGGVDWLAQLSMTYHLTPGGAKPLLMVWWSLPVEIAFYALLPLLATSLGRGVWLLGVALAGSVALRLWLIGGGLTGGEAQLWATHVPGRLDQFVCGMLAAWWLHRRRGLTLPSGATRWPQAALLLAVLIWLMLPRWLDLVPAQTLPTVRWMALWPTVFSALIAALLVLASVADARAAALSAPLRWLSRLGAISYGVYLWHVPALWCVQPWVTLDPPLLRALLLAALALPPTLLLAWLSWRGIEWPALRLVPRWRANPV